LSDQFSPLSNQINTSSYASKKSVWTFSVATAPEF
jgi:hypothetical protein